MTDWNLTTKKAERKEGETGRESRRESRREKKIEKKRRKGIVR